MADIIEIVAAPKHWTTADLNFANAVVKNAVRLLDDASILQTYERWGTAHTLSTIAFEEAGKVALRCWNDDEKVRKVGKSWSFHLKKQAAAACLLLADEAKNIIDGHPARKGLSTFEKGSAAEEERLRHDLAAGIHSSKANRLLELVALYAVERTKQIGLYVDDWTIEQNFAVKEFSENQSRASMEEEACHSCTSVARPFAHRSSGLSTRSAAGRFSRSRSTSPPQALVSAGRRHELRN